MTANGSMVPPLFISSCNDLREAPLVLSCGRKAWQVAAHAGYATDICPSKEVHWVSVKHDIKEQQPHELTACRTSSNKAPQCNKGFALGTFVHECTHPVTQLDEQVRIGAPGSVGVTSKAHHHGCHHFIVTLIREEGVAHHVRLTLPIKVFF